MKAESLSNFFFLLFCFSLNFEVWDPLNTGGFFSVAKLTGFLYLFSILPKLGSYINFARKIKDFLNPVIIFYLWLTLISLFHINPYSGSFLDFSLFQNIILFLIILNHERITPGIIEKGFFYFYIGSLILSLFYFSGIGTEINIEGRVSIFGDNQNIIGMRMVISLLFLTNIIITKRNRYSKIGFLLMILSYIPLIILMFESGSRLAFFSFLLSTGMFFLFRKNTTPFHKILVFTIGVILVIFLYDYALNSEVLGARLTKTKEDGNLAGRDDIWETLIPLINNNWILGVGKTGYAEYVIKKLGALTSPHNVFLEVLAYSGIIGLYLYLITIWRSFYTSYLYFKKYDFLIPFIYCIPILGIMLSGQLLTLKLGWLILSFAASRKFSLQSNKK